MLQAVSGIDSFIEGEREQNLELAHEVFERRMEIDDADDDDELSAIECQVESEYKEKIDDISMLFDKQEFDRVKTILESTKYLE